VARSVVRDAAAGLWPCSAISLTQQRLQDSSFVHVLRMFIKNLLSQCWCGTARFGMITAQALYTVHVKHAMCLL
jgi:hypothetical protein